MGINYCPTCGFKSDRRGLGMVPAPNRRWWQFWRMVRCPDCGGDGYGGWGVGGRAEGGGRKGSGQRGEARFKPVPKIPEGVSPCESRSHGTA